MALVLKTVFKSTSDWIERNADRRIDHLPMMGSPIKVILLTTAYYLFVKKIGPWFMRDRQPYNVKTAMLLYNILQVFANVYIIYKATLMLLNHPAYSDWSCVQRDYSESHDGVVTFYLYYLLKISDYTDTVFMVLRKNWHQITVLHLYHHSMMVLCGYYQARFCRGGHGFLVGYNNLYVHMVMYFYYFLTALSPQLKQSLWWKKYLTQMQILQFLINIVHLVRGLLNEKCADQRPLLYFIAFQDALMIIMFSNFYIKTYMRKPKVGKSAD